LKESDKHNAFVITYVREDDGVIDIIQEWVFII